MLLTFNNKVLSHNGALLSLPGREKIFDLWTDMEFNDGCDDFYSLASDKTIVLNEPDSTTPTEIPPCCQFTKDAAVRRFNLFGATMEITLSCPDESYPAVCMWFEDSAGGSCIFNIGPTTTGGSVLAIEGASPESLHTIKNTATGSFKLSEHELCQDVDWTRVRAIGIGFASWLMNDGEYTWKARTKSLTINNLSFWR